MGDPQFATILKSPSFSKEKFFNNIGLIHFLVVFFKLVNDDNSIIVKYLLVGKTSLTPIF